MLHVAPTYRGWGHRSTDTARDTKWDRPTLLQVAVGVDVDTSVAGRGRGQCCRASFCNGGAKASPAVNVTPGRQPGSRVPAPPSPEAPRGVWARAN